MKCPYCGFVFRIVNSYISITADEPATNSICCPNCGKMILFSGVYKYAGGV